VADNLAPSSPSARTAAVLLAKLVVVLATAYGTIIAKRRGREDLIFGLWVSMMVLINPVVWSHHMILLLMPLALIVGDSFINSPAIELSVV